MEGGLVEAKSVEDGVVVSVVNGVDDGIEDDGVVGNPLVVGVVVNSDGDVPEDTPDDVVAPVDVGGANGSVFETSGDTSFGSSGMIGEVPKSTSIFGGVFLGGDFLGGDVFFGISKYDPAGIIGG